MRKDNKLIKRLTERNKPENKKIDVESIKERLLSKTKVVVNDNKAKEGSTKKEDNEDKRSKIISILQERNNNVSYKVPSNNKVATTPKSNNAIKKQSSEGRKQFVNDKNKQQSIKQQQTTNRIKTNVAAKNNRITQKVKPVQKNKPSINKPKFKVNQKNNIPIGVEKVNTVSAPPFTPNKKIENKKTTYGHKATKTISKSMTSDTVYIVTRTHGRPKAFDRCHRSIINQRHKQIKHIVIVDDPSKAEYVKQYDCITYTIDSNELKRLRNNEVKIDSSKNFDKRRFEYNLYFNTLQEDLRLGWYMVLDDDDYLADENVIVNLLKNIPDYNHFAISQMQFDGAKNTVPHSLNQTTYRYGQIGSPCLFFHSTQFRGRSWDGWKGGDYRFYLSLNTDFSAVQIQQITSKIGGVGGGRKQDVTNLTIPEFILNSNSSKQNKYLIAVSSFNRFEMVKGIYDALNCYENVEFAILNDKSTKGNYAWFKDKPKVTYLENEVNYGKKRYWASMNKLFNVFKNNNCNYLVQMDDDFYTHKDFIKLLDLEVSKFKGDVIVKYIHDASKGEYRWGSKYWIDGGACYPRDFMQKINYQIDPIPMSRWQADPKLSSGVWSQVSKKIIDLNYITYETEFSLVKHLGTEESMMNPEIRKKNKLETLNFIYE